MFSYRVIYQVRDDALVIINVIHGRRLYAPDDTALAGSDSPGPPA